MLRRFLETDAEFYTPDYADVLLTRYPEPFIGLDLPKIALKKIYSGNFRRIWGAKPREVDSLKVALAAERQGHIGISRAMNRIQS